VTALRCTANLLKAMKATPVANPAPATSRLGDWHANLIRVSRNNLVIAVNDATRFGIVVDAAPYADIPLRIAERLFNTLQFIGVPADLAASEAQVMESAQLAATNSKSVLGTLNQYAFEVELDLREKLAFSAVALTQRLTSTIVSNPRHIDAPADRVRERFGLPPIDRRARDCGVDFR
jgi:hypothetical protein